MKVDREGNLLEVTNMIVGEYICFKENKDTKVDCVKLNNMNLTVTFDTNGGSTISPFESPVIIPGYESISEPDGTTSTGHVGDGYARITYIGDVLLNE